MASKSKKTVKTCQKRHESVRKCMKSFQSVWKCTKVSQKCMEVSKIGQFLLKVVTALPDLQAISENFPVFCHFPECSIFYCMYHLWSVKICALTEITQLILVILLFLVSLGEYPSRCFSFFQKNIFWSKGWAQSSSRRVHFDPFWVQKSKVVKKNL